MGISSQKPQSDWVRVDVCVQDGLGLRSNRSQKTTSNRGGLVVVRQTWSKTFHDLKLIPFNEPQNASVLCYNYSLLKVPGGCIRQWGSVNLAPWNIASRKFQDVSGHNNSFPSCTFLSMLSAPPAGPPQKSVSICLSSPAMTQHWLTSEHAHTYKDTHTHFLSAYLSGGSAVSVPMVFALFSCSLSSGMKISRCDWIRADFIFTPAEGLTGVTSSCGGKEIRRKYNFS